MMEVNGDFGAVEEVRSLQGKPYPLFNHMILGLVLGSLYSCKQKKKSAFVDLFRLSVVM